MDDTYQVNPDWRKLASWVVKPQQIVLVIGATDAGKSTFCRFLADFALAKGFKVACVDADIGQSQIGPPTTIGVKSFVPRSETQSPSGEEPILDRGPHPLLGRGGQNPVEKGIVFDGTADRLYFVGDVSPKGHFLEGPSREHA